MPMLKVWSWGAGTHGQLALESMHDCFVPQPVPKLSSHLISHITCGGAHAAAITDKHDVVTWGRGSGGALGHADTTTISLPRLVQSLQGEKISFVSAGWNHTVFVAENGKVFTCGDGTFGQLGHGDYTSCSTPRMIVSLCSQHVSVTACGMRHTLILMKGGGTSRVISFGSSKRGQLGIGHSQTNAIKLQPLSKKLQKECVPQKIHIPCHEAISVIAANGDHSAAITDSGTLYLWGKGYNNDPDILLPLHVAVELSFCQIALGWSHGLGLSRDGQLYTWGRSKLGQSGKEQGTCNHDLLLANFHLPYPAATGVEENQVKASGQCHVFNTSGSGQMKILGKPEKRFNLSYVKGDLQNLEECSSTNADLTPKRPTFWKVRGLEGVKVVQIAAGGEHSALVSDSGLVMTWGWGEHGQLGLDSDHDQGLPQVVPIDGSLKSVKRSCKVAVYCGSGFTFATQKFCR